VNYEPVHTRSYARAPQVPSYKMPAGTWKPLNDGNRRSAVVACHKCGLPATLTEHSIAADGTVNPSLGCPHDGCDAHTWATLDGWGAQ